MEVGEREIRHELPEDFHWEAGQRRRGVALADPAEASPRAESAVVFFALEHPDEVLEAPAHRLNIVSVEPGFPVMVAETQGDVPPVDFEELVSTHGAREETLHVF